MTRETKIALLVGLGLIICFGVILGEARTQRMPDLAGAAGQPIDGDPFEGLTARDDATAIVEVRRPGPSPISQTAEFTSDRAQVEPDRSAPAPEPDPPPPAADPVPVVAPPVSVPVSPVRPKPVQTYTVAPGDSLCKIARTHYGRQNERLYMLIFKANRDKLNDPSTLKAGQRLVIPPLPTRAAAADAPPRTTPRQGAAGGLQTVTTEQLRDHLRRVQDDQRRAPAPVPAPTAGTYTVKRGENLTIIARKLLRDGSPAAVRRLYRANVDKLDSPDLLPAGTVLVLPG